MPTKPNKRQDAAPNVATPRIERQSPAGSKRTQTRANAPTAIETPQRPTTPVQGFAVGFTGHRRRFSDSERAMAVLLLQTNGYPDRPGALTETANALGLQSTVLRQWATGETNPPPAHLLADVKEDLTSILDDVIRLNLERARDPIAVSKTSAAQAMTTAAIAIDKQRLINGLPTEIVSMIPDYLQALRLMGTDAMQIMQRTIERAETEYGLQRTIEIPASAVRSKR